MKRREFLKGISAAASSTALPASVFAGKPVISQAVYNKAVYYTRLWGTSVPEMYTSAFGLDFKNANTLFGKLISNNVLKAPNASGVSNAVSPMFGSSSMAVNVQNLPNSSPKSNLVRNAPKSKATADLQDQEEDNQLDLERLQNEENPVSDNTQDDEDWENSQDDELLHQNA